MEIHFTSNVKPPGAGLRHNYLTSFRPVFPAYESPRPKCESLNMYLMGKYMGFIERLLTNNRKNKIMEVFSCNIVYTRILFELSFEIL